MRIAPRASRGRLVFAPAELRYASNAVRSNAMATPFHRAAPQTFRIADGNEGLLTVRDTVE
jgi:hypothetical protein